jgi:hypothetical protein
MARLALPGGRPLLLGAAAGFDLVEAGEKSSCGKMSGNAPSDLASRAESSDSSSRICSEISIARFSSAREGLAMAGG